MILPCIAAAGGHEPRDGLFRSGRPGITREQWARRYCLISSENSSTLENVGSSEHGTENRKVSL